MADPLVNAGKGAAGAAPKATDMKAEPSMVSVTVAPGNRITTVESTEEMSVSRPDGSMRMIKVPTYRHYGPGETFKVPAAEAARLVKLGSVVDPNAKPAASESAKDGPSVTTADSGPKVKVG